MENVEAPTHHLALAVGHNAGLFSKIAELMNIPYAIYWWKKDCKGKKEQV